MARELPRSPKSGPYLTAALLCERDLVEPDGTHSAIRIIDQVVLSMPPAQLPAGAVFVPAVLNASLLFMLKTGEAPGKYPVRVEMEDPAGARRLVGAQDLVLGGTPNAGANFTVQMTLTLKDEGLYRFEVFLDDEFATAVPLLVLLASSPPLSRSGSEGHPG